MAHGPNKKRLDFSGNPDLDPDSGIFHGILPLWATAILRMGVVVVVVSGMQLKIA